MIDKSMSPAPLGLDATNIENFPEDNIEVVIEGSDAANDGSVTVDLTGSKTEVTQSMRDNAPFTSNLAEFMDESALRLLADELLEGIDDDIQSRAEWSKTYVDGLELLGLKIEDVNEPWEGACNVTHPLLLESVVKFQAETITETFPASGPVKTRIIGDLTPEKEAAGRRVQADMNEEIVDVMTEYRLEHERMLLNLPIAGSAFKKVYYDKLLNRQTAMFVSAEDFIVSYGATDLETCPRYTYRARRTPDEIKRLQAVGFFREVELGDPVRDTEDVREKKDKISGIYEHKELRHTNYETCVDLDLAGFESEDGIYKPYVVTVDKDSKEILSVYRNWEEDDAEEKKILHFVHYQYVTGLGFYGFGLIHLVGGFARGATSLLRQLVDAGTLSNLPGGLKTKGMRIKGDDDPIGPGEWRDVDVPSGSLKDNLMALPYKEPSMVLASLLEKIVAEGRKMAAVAEMDIADFDSNSPVGTTLALLERTLKVMSAIQARVYASMKQEFKLLKKIISDNGSPVYRYTPEGGDPSTKQADYAMVDILPVADPNAATMAQKIVQMQAVIQLAQTAPQIYDLPDLHSRMLETVGMKNLEKLIPSLKGVKEPIDPVSENMAILMGKPVKAFLAQDHEAHITVHQSAMQDPKIMALMGQNPQAQMIMAAAQSHLGEHIAFAYRNQLEEQLGTQLPPPDEPLPAEIEVQLSGLLAQAAKKLLDVNKVDAEAKQAEAAAKDPVVQMQQEELAIKRQAVTDKKDIADKELKLKATALLLKAQTDKSKMKVDVLKAGAQAMGQHMQRKSTEKMGMIGHVVTTHNEKQRLTAQERQAERARQAQDVKYTEKGGDK